MSTDPNDPRLFSEMLKDFRNNPSVKKLIRETKKELRKQQRNVDTEDAHASADAELCGFLSVLGFDDVVKEYSLIDKWYA